MCSFMKDRQDAAACASLPVDDAALAALAAFGVPFAAYDADGHRRYASPAALALVDADAAGSLVWGQAARLARAALLEAGAWSEARDRGLVPTPMDWCALSVRVRRTAMAGRLAVVI